jgi:hypothetical protein
MSRADHPNESGILLGIILIALLSALLAGSLYFGVEPGPVRPGTGGALASEGHE